MRRELLGVVVLVLGCAEAPRGALRVLTADATGAPLALGSGQTLDVGPLSTDCASRHSFSLENAGQAPVQCTLQAESIEVTVEPTSLVLERGERAPVTLRIWPTSPAAFSSALVLDCGAFQARFGLEGSVFAADEDWPRELDFGGLEPGSVGRLDVLPLEGVSAPFASDGGTSWFAPAALGHFAQRVNIARRPDCSPRFLRLRGDGVARQLSGPATVEFGVVPVGSAAVATVVVRTLAMLPTTVSLDAVGAGDFSLVDAGRTLATREADGGLVAGEVGVLLRFTPASPPARWSWRCRSQVLAPRERAS